MTGVATQRHHQTANSLKFPPAGILPLNTRTTRLSLPCPMMEARLASGRMALNTRRTGTENGRMESVRIQMGRRVFIVLPAPMPSALLALRLRHCSQIGDTSHLFHPSVCETHSSPNIDLQCHRCTHHLSFEALANPYTLGMPEGGFMHATNQSNAQGTAFAIAYESDLTKIAMEDLVVFSVLPQYEFPWRRIRRQADLSQHTLAQRGDIRSAVWHAFLPRGRLYVCLALGTEELWSTQHVGGIQLFLMRSSVVVLIVLLGICKDSNAMLPVPLVTRKLRKRNLRCGAPTMRQSAVQVLSRWLSLIVCQVEYVAKCSSVLTGAHRSRGRQCRRSRI